MNTAVKQRPEYLAISAYYGTDTAKRSGVPLMNHIDEGVAILAMIHADLDTQLAFCLHPLFQMDSAFVSVGTEFARQHPGPSVWYAVEYRGIANAYLAHHALPPNGIRLSPLVQVNQMLVADKIQNRKDFHRYHLHSHPNAARLDEYFSQWLAALGVSEEQYQEIIAELS